jgi:DNA modification methylase
MDFELNRIICGDCLEVMKLIPDKSIDLVLTDPPYGIGADKGVGGFGSSPKSAKKYVDNWDIRPEGGVFRELLRVGKTVIIFGGNYFTDLLPVNGHWIVWDKVCRFNFQNPFSDCEMAWTNVSKKTVKKYVIIQQGFISEEKERFHPTQKPVKLFQMIIADYSNPADLILDPFAGSGTTCVAAKMLGRRYVGIEISPEYCEIAERRISNTAVNGRLFEDE